MTKARSNATAPAAKGELVIGTGTDTSGVLSVGSANQVLTVDSSTATGLKWAAPAGGTFTNYTPTITQGSSLAKTVNYAYYFENSNFIAVWVRCTVTATGTAGSAVLCSLPVTMDNTPGNSYATTGVAELYDVSAGLLYRAIINAWDPDTIQFYSTTSTADLGLGANTFTAALASGDSIFFSMIYRKA